MNNDQIFNRDTRVFFVLDGPVEVFSLADMIGGVLCKEHFTMLRSTVSEGAGSVTMDGTPFRIGKSLREVISVDLPLVSFASSHHVEESLNLRISIIFGVADGAAFNGKSMIDAFTLIANCRMDRRILPEIIEQIEDPVVRDDVLKTPRKAYSLVKRLFLVLGAQKCVGVDSKNYTGSFFDDPVAFYFSKNEASLPSELLEHK